ncbi:DMT family transporter [Rhodoferax sp. PAMC 29310]|uniref:DMT family transporter n=1 Tax=Rhodoferax sp. PAMC 29310 TaxID=2822760 RepID=UPI001B33FD34|nr:DMT family transporter [Rhodoferax sp. PAMC 29310]
MSRLNANLILILVALIWGSAFVAQSIGMAHIGPMTFTGVRFLIGALVVAPVMGWEWRQLRVNAKPLKGIDGLKIAGLGSLLLLGAAMQQIGIVSTTVTNAGFLTALYVPMVPLLSWLLLRQRPHWSAWPGALACLGDAYLLSGVRSLSFVSGDAWVIASTLPWALHVLLIGRVADRLSAPFLVAGGQFLVCGVVASGLALAYEPITHESLNAAIWPLLYTGVLSVGVAFTLQVVAQRFAQATDAAIFLSAETLFAALFGYLMMDERLNAAGVAGCGLILLSMLSVQLLPLLPVLYRRASAKRALQSGVSSD